MGILEPLRGGDAISTDNTCVGYQNDDSFSPCDLCLNVFRSQKILGLNLPFWRLKGGRRGVNFPTSAALFLSLSLSHF